VAVVLVLVLLASAAVVMPLLVAPGQLPRGASSVVLFSVNEGGVAATKGRNRFREGDSDGRGGGALGDSARAR
jgi:hypothetical protein